MPVLSNPLFDCKIFVTCTKGAMSANMRRTTTEALLNWIEVWRVWWQEDEDATEALNDFSKGICFMNHAVVENQDALVLRERVHRRQLVDDLVDVPTGRMYNAAHHVIDNEIQKVLPIKRTLNDPHSFISIQ
jgi:hypothetical protein